MPYMKGHLEAGFYASMGLVAIPVIGFHHGYVATQYDVFRFSLFVVIGNVIESDLTDVDARFTR